MTTEKIDLDDRVRQQKPRRAASSKLQDPAYNLKRAIWAYYLLLIFEGALRKWILPGLATPLLIVRDPIALYLIIQALRKGFLPANGYVITLVIVGFAGTITAVFLGHGNLWVALYGARIFILHFPVIFVMGNVLNRDDVVKMGVITLWIAIPMAILIALQFYSPQSALVNRGVGGDAKGGGFSGVGDFFRPPGTFSFTNGTTLFFSFIAPYVFYFWLNRKLIQQWLLVGATVALLISIPLSISRALLLSVVVTAFFTMVVVARNPKYIKTVVAALIAMSIAAVLLSQLTIFQTAITAFTDRFEGANESEGGLQSVIMDRYFGGLISSFTDSDRTPFWGYGQGALTNIGTNLLPYNENLVALEGEWQRIVGEMGLIMGMIVIYVRVAFSFQEIVKSFRALKFGDILPWLFASNFLLNMPQGQWKQPTSLGFSIVIGGLLLASLNRKRKARFRTITL